MVSLEKRRERGREYYHKHKEKRRAKWRIWAAENKEALRAYKRKQCAKRRKELRDEIVLLLGSICIQCEFSDVRALQIDHVNAGGAAERKRLGTDITYLCKILKSAREKGSEEYQLLCANCNWIKRYSDYS